jgi:D-beta-D-heptose 7-phosphate kinase/D-beta-D-heptose 1-phosphate adenosyltransferase
MDATAVDRLADADVLVLGDVLLDRFIEGKVSRTSPEAPVAVLRYGGAHASLGGAGNVAANLLAFGAAATLVGLVGSDEAAAEIAALCRAFPRLRDGLIADPSRPTTVKTRYLAGWQQLLRVDSEDPRPAAEDLRRRLVGAVRAALPQSGAVILSDYAKGVLDETTVAAVIAAARTAGVPVVIDPKKVDPVAFAGATLITPNAEEMAQIAGIAIDSDEAAAAACRRVLERIGLDAVLVTRGEAGMTLLERGAAEPLHVRAAALRVYDVTGAGDTVVATVGAALAAGQPLRDAVRLANLAASIVVAKPGTAIAHPHELRRAIGSTDGSSVVDRRDAVEQVRVWKEGGLFVGFTNGCFDLLHRGHLYSLEQAARRCDRLVVGVNSDASTRRLKGAGRPVQDEATRAAVLAALRPVALVVVFDEDTPQSLIAALQPGVLFKGADYEGKEVVGQDIVEAAGGRVELLPLLPGHSTTRTVDALRSDSD